MVHLVFRTTQKWAFSVPRVVTSELPDFAISKCNYHACFSTMEVQHSCRLQRTLEVSFREIFMDT